MSFYPAKVQKRFDSPRNTSRSEAANANGRSASFLCGSFVSFTLSIDAESKIVASAAFRSNGCGFMVAAADVLAELVTGKHLADLHGLDKTELRQRITDELDAFRIDRSHCVETCIEALRASFADYRTHQLEEFQGEKALICTCFGVSEATIESFLSQPGAASAVSSAEPVATGFSSLPMKTVEDVTRICNAGGGCGSCRMLIQEIIDANFQCHPE